MKIAILFFAKVWAGKSDFDQNIKDHIASRETIYSYYGTYFKVISDIPVKRFYLTHFHDDYLQFSFTNQFNFRHGAVKLL